MCFSRASIYTAETSIHKSIARPRRAGGTGLDRHVELPHVVNSAPLLQSYYSTSSTGGKWGTEGAGIGRSRQVERLVGPGFKTFGYAARSIARCLSTRSEVQLDGQSLRTRTSCPPCGLSDSTGCEAAINFVGVSDVPLALSPDRASGNGALSRASSGVARRPHKRARQRPRWRGGPGPTNAGVHTGRSHQVMSAQRHNCFSRTVTALKGPGPVRSTRGTEGRRVNDRTHRGHHDPPGLGRGRPRRDDRRRAVKHTETRT
jgi:hypothetical protein